MPNPARAASWSERVLPTASFPLTSWLVIWSSFGAQRKRHVPPG